MTIDVASAMAASPDSGAVLSDDGMYRYALWRRVDSDGRVVDMDLSALWILLNPSTADASVNDATVRKGMGFCRRWGIGRMVFANAFALRSRDPKALRKHRDPVGPENDAVIAQLLAQGHRHVILAWGGDPTPARLQRDQVIAGMLVARGIQAMCLGVTGDGAPRHPLMLAYDTELVPWRPRNPTQIMDPVGPVRYCQARGCRLQGAYEYFCGRHWNLLRQHAPEQANHLSLFRRRDCDLALLRRAQDTVATHDDHVTSQQEIFDVSSSNISSARNP